MTDFDLRKITGREPPVETPDEYMDAWAEALGDAAALRTECEALRARVADGDVVRGDLQTVADVLRDYEGETVWQQAQAAVARVAELEAAVTRYRQYEYVEAQHDETGRSWFGARYNIPTRFHEVSNESGEPGPTARAAVNKEESRNA